MSSSYQKFEAKGVSTLKSISPYLFLDNCGEGLEFYQSVLGGELKDVSKDPNGKYMHAELVLSNGMSIHFSDSFRPVTKGDNVGVMLNFDSEDEIRRVWECLKPGAQVNIDLQVTFWGALHGNLTDKYGVFWLLNCPIKK